MDIMIKISKRERDNLKKVGLLKDRRVGYRHRDANYTVANREHCGRDKTIYITEEPEIMLFLGKYDNLNLQSISREQLKNLLDKKLITVENIQKWNTYIPNALVFEDYDGNYRMKKNAKLMIELNFWNANTKPKDYEDQEDIEDIFLNNEKNNY